MICFLTSLPVIEETDEINPANRFLIELRRCIASPCRALYICSDPDCDNTYWSQSLKKEFEAAGFVFSSFAVLDGRTEKRAKELIGSADFIILTGGHVPTQNRFFHKIGLTALLQGFDGVLMGISAGSMNSAETVYAQPEEPGEAVDPKYERFLPGLGLTKNMLLPHYYGIKDGTLDGLRILEDITLPDSMGKTFYFIPDGTCLYIEPGRTELRGEAYRVRDGVIMKVSQEGDVLTL